MLGIVWLRGPCTIYVVMKELEGSPSSFHKSRAGTAYSVAHRLLKFGLLEAVGEHVQVSAEGMEEFGAWFRPPMPEGDVVHSVDLLRLRFFFAGAISQEERLQLIDDCAAQLRAFEEKLIGMLPEVEESGEYFGLMAALAMVMETRTRLKWFGLVRDWVENPIKDRWAERMLGAINEP